MLDLYFSNQFDKAPIEEVIKQAMSWHFSPETASNFWLEKAKSFDFDPIADITNLKSLEKFPDITSEWKETPLENLIPKGLEAHLGDLHVFESGGTTGAPSRIIESISRRRALNWVNRHLINFGIHGKKFTNWLHIGPTGPHIVGRSIGLLAQMQKRLCYYIDFDPRWVKNRIRANDIQTAEIYLDHIIEQAATVLSSQNISVLFATPPILEAICKKPYILKLFQSKINAIIWAGTSVNKETLHLIETVYFPDAILFGIYGNTLMGIAPQRTRSANDDEPCVFQPAYPFCYVDVVNPQNTSKTVPYGAYGQVKVHLLTPEIFAPNHLERDLARRIRPTRKFVSDGLADIQPLQNNNNEIIQGVY